MANNASTTRTFASAQQAQQAQQVPQAQEDKKSTKIKNITSRVENKVLTELQADKLKLPEGYYYGTAIQAALFKLQVKDNNGMDFFDKCTNDTIAIALLDMVTQGLHPGKNQCYFIAYGNQCTLQRSYFGTIAALRNAVPNVGRVICDLAHEGDEAEYGYTEYGERYIIRITTDPLKNIEKPIAFGFCNIYSKDKELLGFTIMTWADIQKSWAKSKNPNNKTQREFPTEMAKRTLIARACKILLNASTDSDSLAADAFNRTTAAEYDNSEESAPVAVEAPSRKSFKERYGIKASNIVEAKAEQVPEATPVAVPAPAPQAAPAPDPAPKSAPAPTTEPGEITTTASDNNPNGPENFESATFEQDSFPTSEELPF